MSCYLGFLIWHLIVVYLRDFTKPCGIFSAKVGLNFSYWEAAIKYNNTRISTEHRI